MKDVPSLIIMISVILVSGCIYPNYETETRAVFDIYHGEIFPPLGETTSSYSELYKQLQNNGFDTSINVNPITQDALSNVNVLVFVGPMTKFETQEINAIKKFVQNGGNLLVLAHISSPLNGLMQEFNITISGSVTSESENLIDSSPQNFFVKDLENHTITKGIKQIAVFGSWSLQSKEPARTVAWTSKTAWSEVTKNMKFDNESEKQERLGIVSAVEYGRGKVVVITDDAVFLNKFIDIADNRMLGENIILWFKEK
jgi:hypothetical protein